MGESEKMSNPFSGSDRNEMNAKGKEDRALYADLLSLNATFEAARAGDGGGIELAKALGKWKARVLRGLKNEKMGG